MSRSALKFTLMLSVLLNLGVLGAVTYRAFQDGQWPALLSFARSEAGLPEYLKLTAEQRRQWHELEAGFVRELQADWQQIRNHRDTMIREIFADTPDRNRIEAERAAIAQLQAKQQQRVIEQLLKERDVLDSAQQRALAELLIRQAPATTLEERLHGR